MTTTTKNQYPPDDLAIMEALVRNREDLPKAEKKRWLQATKALRIAIEKNRADDDVSYIVPEYRAITLEMRRHLKKKSK